MNHYDLKLPEPPWKHSVEPLARKLEALDEGGEEN